MGKSKNKLPIAGAKEYRAFAVPDLQAVPEGNIVEGHAAVIGEATNIGGIFNEVIEPGSFNATDFRDVLLSINHQLESIPLARSRNNNQNSTLQLTVDSVGLAIRAQLDTENNAEAKAVYSAIQRQDITGMSFIFIVRDEYWTDLDTDMPTRHITDIGKVIETSIVNFPAYSDTDVNARNSDALDSAKDLLDSKRAEHKAALDTERRKKLILKTYL